MSAASHNALTRPRSGRVLAGVCLGVARRFGWDVTVVRIVSVVGVIFFGLPVWIYLLLWLLMPNE
ncbi:MAG: PspC domain-containing protein [Pseudoclavibacter sp.]